jgi:hypothetical protein
VNIPQTTYPIVPVEGFNGKADQCQFEDIVSRTAESLIAVGAFQYMGTNPPGAAGVSNGGVKLIPDGTVVGSIASLIGVAMMDFARSPFLGTANTSSGTGQYQIGDDVPLMRRGRCWMYSETAVTQGDPVYVRVTAAGVAVTGQVRDGATANFVLHPTAVFMNTTSAAGIALVEIK